MLRIVAATVAIAACSHPESAKSPVAPIAQVFATQEMVPAFSDPQRRAKLEAAFRAIDRALVEEMQSAGLDGFTFGIVIDGDLAYAKGFGTIQQGATVAPTPDTVYRIGSLSKSITALAIYALRDAGKLTLDDPLAKWIPEAAGIVYPTRDAPVITLRHLLHHTSGLQREGSFDGIPTEDAVVKSLRGLVLEDPPGEHAYSNINYSLLGVVAGRADKTSYQDVVSRRVLVPLGMMSTYFTQDQVPPARLAPAYRELPTGLEPKPVHERIGVGDAAGGIYASLRDLARFAAFELTAYPPRGEADTGPVKRATVREMHSMGIPNLALARVEPKGLELRAGIYAGGWIHEDNCVSGSVWNSGAMDSYRANIRMLPTRGVAIVMLTNFPARHRILDRVIAELDGTGALKERLRKPSPKTDAAARELLAVYNNWNEAAYKALFDPSRDDALATEKEELASYRALHGTCSAVSPIEVRSPGDVDYAFTCERGTLEMLVSTTPSGRVGGFVGTSRGVEPPPALAKLAAASAATTHPACKLGPAHRTGFDWSFELACPTGRLVLDAALSKDATKLERALVHPPPVKTNCPS